jgi:glycosyltransferase involved in cell wall biosynthesis
MHVLIPALARLRQTTDTWHCTVAGNGDVQHFTQMASEAGLDEKMTFTGWIEANDMLALMRRSDVVVLPSYRSSATQSDRGRMRGGGAGCDRCRKRP